MLGLVRILIELQQLNKKTSGVQNDRKSRKFLEKAAVPPSCLPRHDPCVLAGNDTFVRFGPRIAGAATYEFDANSTDDA
jgi:hypothetical protein